MKKNLLFILVLIFLTTTSKAQDFEYGAHSQQDLDMKQYDKDTSAHALVLDEHGKASIAITSDNTIKVVYEYHVKIKIFDSKGFSKSNVEISLSNSDDKSETLELIRGVTTYTDDDGSIKSTELDPKKVYRSRVNKYWTTEKFAMPSVRNGCIIEYTYTTYSPFVSHFPKWMFQSDIPKVHSEYDVHIPGYWVYNVALRGPLKLTENIADIERGCFYSGGSTTDCAHLTYGMNAIPAFIVESDMTSPMNFLSAISFQLSEYTNLSTGVKTKYAQEWQDIDYNLKHSDTFGAQLRKKNIFKDAIAALIVGKTDSMEKAKAVFEYIQKNIKWNGFYGTGSMDGLRKALELHSGSVADINLSVAAALDEAGFNAEAVLLSTREHGFINKLYPVTEDFNYVVAKVDIRGKSYLLDATDPLLPFGILPLHCLNDQGRVMSLDKPSYWIDMNTGQKRVITTTLDVTLMSDGKLKGTMTYYYIGYEAYEKRKEIKKFNSVDEYIESINQRSTKFRILHSDIANLDSLDLPLSETFEIEIKKFNNLDADDLNFNPFITDHITRNPYRLAERTYPIDRGMPLTERFALTVHLPDNYLVASSPKDVAISLPNNGGTFETFFQTGASSFEFSHIVQFNKAIYSSEEYPYLKELYNKIILSEKTPVVLKKKN